MTPARRIGILTVATLAAIVFTAVLFSSRTAHAALARDAGIQLVAPAHDAVVYESGLRFAWQPAPGTARHFLLVSREPFETRGATRLPAGDDVRVVPVDHPIASLADAGLTISGDQPVYWAAAGTSADGRRTWMSDVRRVVVLGRFTNRVEPSPLVSVTPILPAHPIERVAPDRIHLRAGYDIDPTRGEPVLPAALREAAGPTMGRRTYIVYFADGDPEATRKTVLESGGTIVSYLPDRAFLVRMESTGQLSLDTEGAWVGAFQPAYKLSPRLSPDPVASEIATLLLFPDGDLDQVAGQVQRLGASVVLRSDNGINRLLRVRATRAALDGLAQNPDVEWIEPYVQPTMDNVSVQWVVQTWSSENRRVWDLGIRGNGQVICTTDAGIDVSHNMFRDAVVPIPGFGDYPTHRKIIAYKAGSLDPGVAFGDHGVYHGTHTACTAAGSDSTIGTDVRDGVAKDAKLYFMDLSGPALANSVAPPADLNDLYQPSYTGNAGGAARISSNSWGGAVMGAYDLSSQQVDQFMWNHPDYLLCFSNGNSGGFQTVGSPATAKNSVGVGGTRNGTTANFIYTGTSRGPTQDGRRKPTVCTPGQNVISASVGPNSFQSLTGTSMASPGCAGAAALIREYLTEGWYPTGAKVPGNAFTPSAALLKAMLINSGSNTVSGGQVPDQNIGFGRVTVDSVLYFAGDTRRLLLVDYAQGLTNGQAIEYVVNVSNTAIPLKVSLCWTDYPGNPVVTTQIVNNLDLTVTNGVQTYRGNNMVNGVSQAGGSADVANVEEEAQISVPTSGLWRIRIDAPTVPIGPQPFALCVTGGIGTDAGVLALDRASYGSASSVGLRVTDTNAGGSVTVSLTSPSEPAGENVILTGSNGIYTGSIPLSPFSGAVGDGTLRVSNGDLITATYVDASPSATLTSQAQIDFVPPTITGVSALNSGAGNVTVSWTTNGSATSHLYYGASPALGSSVPESFQFVTSHALMISGLSAGQTYYYDVESQDLNGNVTRDDNGGQHYRFTVSGLSDILLVYADPGFPKHDRYVSALTSLGWSFDVWTGALAQSPALGDLTSGLRAYKAVWWESYDAYPPFEDGARTTLTQYLDGGGRLVVAGHDIAWALGDASSPSPYYTPDRAAWLQGTLHTQFLADPAGWAGVFGVPGDPISGDYTISIPYSEHRAGGSGDEVSSVPGAGAASYDWISDEATPDNCGFRWESTGPLGVPGSGAWGGTPSRIAAMYYEWPDLDPGHQPVSATRTAIMDKTLNWLIGRSKPTAAVLAPNGGETLVSNSTSISWTESTGGGTSVGARTIQYSVDGGQSWVTLTTSASASPYTWNLTTVPNSASVLVRVRVADDGTPTLSAFDASDAVFAVTRPGGDAIGPAVVAGSIFASPNPINNQAPATLTASVTDVAAGNSNITAAEWSFGDIAAPGGSGHAMSGAFGTPTASVNAALTTATFAPGTHALWVRGRDAAGNWGQAARLPVVVNGPQPLAVGDSPLDFALKANAPNPVSTTTTIAYALPQRGNVDLAIYDVTGRRIRTLVQGDVSAGLHQVEWDRSTGDGRLVQPGVYYYRLAVAGHRFERRMVTLN